MQTEQTIITVPLNRLSLSPANSRKRRSTAHIAAIWESLKAHGQLQNLVVTAAEDGNFLVDAGGNRMLAFQLGLQRGEITAEHPVLCRQIGAAGALEASTAENVIREDMHPADQYKAFHRMVESGKSTAEIAAQFSVAESVVAGRLKLANAAPELFELYEKGEMKLDQLQALALTDDHDAQRRAWFGQKGAKVEHDWQRSPHKIRERITAREIGPDNPLAKFVGVERYEAAGGGIRRDMFSPAVYFSDAKLLEKLAGERLEAVAEPERAAGWAWIDTHLELDYSGQSRYGHGPFNAKRKELSPAEKKRMAAIDKRLQEIERLQDNDEEDGDDYQALEAEADDLRGERAELEASREEWSAEAKAKTGVLIYIDQYCGLQINRGRLKPGQKLNGGKVQGGKEAGPKKPNLSQDMLARLEMQRTAAIREHIAARPADAMTLLLQALLCELLPGRASSLLSVNATNQHLADAGDKFGEIKKAPARTALERRAEKWLPTIPKNGADLVPWLDKLSQDQRHELLALLVAFSLPVAQGHGKALAARFGVNMATWWAPTADTFIELVPKALLAEAVSEVSGKPAGEALLAKKKDAAMAEAAKQLAGTGWLPKPLRGDGYALTKAGATAATASASAKMPAGKAPATKKAAKKKAPASKAVKKPAPKKAPAKKAAKGGAR